MKAYQYDKAKMIIDGLIALVWFWVAWNGNQSDTIRILSIMVGALWFLRVINKIINRPHIEITKDTITINRFLFRTNIYNINEIKNISKVVKNRYIEFQYTDKLKREKIYLNDLAMPDRERFAKDFQGLVK